MSDTLFLIYVYSCNKGVNKVFIASPEWRQTATEFVSRNHTKKTEKIELLLSTVGQKKSLKGKMMPRFSDIRNSGICMLPGKLSSPFVGGPNNSFLSSIFMEVARHTEETDVQSIVKKTWPDLFRATNIIKQTNMKIGLTEIGRFLRIFLLGIL